MSSSREISIIEYYGAGEGHKCGYCKGLKSSLSSGRLIFFQYDYVSNVVFVHHVFFSHERYVGAFIKLYWLPESYRSGMAPKWYVYKNLYATPGETLCLIYHKSQVITATNQTWRKHVARYTLSAVKPLNFS